MNTVLKLRARVLPGSRIEVTAPQLSEGDMVDVVVSIPNSSAQSEARYVPAFAFLQSLPTADLSLKDWERIEREIKTEKNAWD